MKKDWVSDDDQKKHKTYYLPQTDSNRSGQRGERTEQTQNALKVTHSERGL